MNSIEEAWEETLLVPPPFVVPMWVRGRNQETAAVSKYQRGVNRTGVLPGTEVCKQKMKRRQSGVLPGTEVTSSTKGKLQTRRVDQTFLFPSTFTSARNAQQKRTRMVRLPNSSDGNEEKKGAEKKK